MCIFPNTDILNTQNGKITANFPNQAYIMLFILKCPEE